MRQLWQQISIGIAVILGQNAWAQTLPAEQIFKQAEQRQAALDAAFTPNIEMKNIALPSAAFATISAETACFPIQQLRWQIIDPPVFQPNHRAALFSALDAADIRAQRINEEEYRLQQKEHSQAPCLNAAQIQNLAATAQNALIDKGYITSRVLTPEQDISQGTLTLHLLLGKVGELSLNRANDAENNAHRANFFTAFPTSGDQILQLRDIEQGLENLRRLPSVNAQIDIQPSAKAGYSDILIDWQQRDIPFRLYLNADNSGSKQTGKYLGTISLAWDNPLRLNDILSASYTHSLKAGVKRQNPQGGSDKSSTHNYALQYSLPFGYWQLGIGMSDYHYTQIVAGINKNYHYSGKSRQANLNLSRVLYRDRQHKITADAGLWRKTTRSYIDDAELDIQRRRVGGWTAGIASRSYFNFGTLNTNLRYKRGTRAFGAIPAPEELFNEGTGKMKIWTADIQWQIPFKFAEQAFEWQGQWHAQWNKSPLTAQDKISIGGLYSVRGFDGETSLSAEKGWYLRNELTWQYHNHHQLYLGIDTGHVSGNSTQYLPGQNLTGAVLGIKGQIQAKGQWHYDLFIGTPLQQPQGFTDNKTVFGFNFSYGL